MLTADAAQSSQVERQNRNIANTRLRAQHRPEFLNLAQFLMRNTRLEKGQSNNHFINTFQGLRTDWPAKMSLRVVLP